MNYKKKALFLIAITTLVRCVIASCTDLGNDEVYYRMYAQYLQWNYFDHPPMVGWLIRATTANLQLDNEFFVRLGAITSAAITSWLLFLSGKKLNGEYTGFIAAVIYTATIYGSIIAGLFILPDSPQMVCWASSLYLLISISENNDIDQSKKYNIFWFGVSTGIGMLCKIHTSFLWLGFLIYILFYNSRLLKQPVLYISAATTLLLFYPVVKWNIDHHFITYLYHSKRVNVASGILTFSSFFTFATGQLFYYNLIIFPFIIVSIIAAFKNKLPVKRSQKRMLLLCSLPLIGLTVLISFFKDVLPHWPGPAYSGLILLTACYFSAVETSSNLRKPLTGYLTAALVLLAIASAGGTLLINFFPGTLGKKETQSLGEGDFTLDMYGWNDMRTSFKKIAQHDEQRGVMKNGAAIISNKWFTAAHLDYYIAMPLNKKLLALGDTSDIHQYAWLNAKRGKLSAGDDAYCIVLSENYYDVQFAYSSLFTTILPPEIIVQKRNGKPCRRMYVYRLKTYKG